ERWGGGARGGGGGGRGRGRWRRTPRQAPVSSGRRCSCSMTVVARRCSATASSRTAITAPPRCVRVSSTTTDSYLVILTGTLSSLRQSAECPEPSARLCLGSGSRSGLPRGVLCQPALRVIRLAIGVLTAGVTLTACVSSLSASSSPASSTTTASSAIAADLDAAYTTVVKNVSPSVVLIETGSGLGSGEVYDNKGDIVT